MPCASNRLLASTLAIAACLGAPGTVAATTTAAADRDAAERLILAATVNGREATDAVAVERRGTTVWMAAADLRAIGLPAPRDGDRVALQSIKGLTFAIDEAAQTLTITCACGPRHAIRAAPAPEDSVPVTPNGWGGVASYDLSATRTGRRTTAGGLVEGTVYGPHGYAYTSALIGAEAADGGTIRRLDSNVTFADPRRLRRLIVGDVIAGGTGATRPVRLGGVQLATDFGLRPDLVTFPVPSIGADAAVPSAVDVIVNGSRQNAGDVAPGPFSVTDLPVQTGLNTISVAVRDALGREQVRTVTTYASTAMLGAGLSDYAVSAGLLRTGYATRADRYRALVVLADWRHGLSSNVTVTAHGEAARGLINAAVGAATTLGPFGLLDGTMSGSASRASTGVQLIAGWERVAHPVALSARLTLTSDGWRDLAALHGAVVRRHSFVANVSFDLGRFGAVTGSVIDLGRGRARVGVDLPARSIDADTFTAATYSVRLTRFAGLTATAGGNPHRARSFYASLGLLFTIGPRTSGYAGVVARDDDTDARADIARPALLPGEFGYRASVASGLAERAAGGVEYIGPHGYYALDGERVAGRTALRATARGSLVAAGGGLFATDRIDGSFAIVDASGQAGLPIYRDHRRIGRTDRHGRMIVANLPAYQPARIGFDPDDLPVAAATADGEAMVKPAERAGARVRFRIYHDSAVTLRLVDGDGVPLPAGTRVSVNDGDDLPVGFDGAAYLLVARPRNRLTAHLPDGRYCEAGFTRPASTAADAAPIAVTCRTLAIATASRQ